jgi:RNA polymerase sporulation-specific sigma factor
LTKQNGEDSLPRQENTRAEKNPDEKYDAMVIEDVVKLAASDENAVEYILKKYKNFVRSKARPYFLMGADKEDIVQEGMIGLYKAIRDYDSVKRASFHAFADLCVTRQIITAVKTATRKKHTPLNSYVSLNRPAYDEVSERALVDTIETSKVSDPEEIFIGKEDMRKVEEEIQDALSKFEKDVFLLYIHGMTYQEIAKTLGRTEKSIDNALQRAKGKIYSFMAEKG